MRAVRRTAYLVQINRANEAEKLGVLKFFLKRLLSEIFPTYLSQNPCNVLCDIRS